MDEETQTTAATHEQQQTAPATTAPAVSYVVVTPIEHDKTRYNVGALFPAAVATAEQIAVLLKEGALKYAHEVEAAARVAVELAAKDEELAKLRAEVAALAAKSQQANRR